MADVTLSRVPFPVGTTVGAYLGRAQVGIDGRGPIGTPAAVAVVDDRSALTFTNLTRGEFYIAAAQIAGQWTFIAVAAGLDYEATGDEAQEDETITGVWRFVNGLQVLADPEDPNDVVRLKDLSQDPIGVGITGRLRFDLNDVTVLFLGDSTGAEVVMDTPYPRRLAEWWGDRYPAFTVLYFLWNETTHDYNDPETIVTGTGDHTLYVYNGCASGERTHYHLAPYFDTIVTSKQPDLCSISHGHNQGNPPNADNLRCDLMCLAESVRKACPTCELVLQVQNPHFFTDDGVHQDGQRDLVRDQYGYQVTELSRELGYGLVNQWEMFFEHTNGDEQAIMDLLDAAHLHPLEDGQQLMTDNITRRLVSSQGAMPRTQPPPALTVSGHNYLANPLFEDWTPQSVEVDQSGNGHDAVGAGTIVTGSDADTKFPGYQSTAFDGTDDALLVPFEPYVAGQPFLFTVTLKRTDNLAGHAVWGAEDADGPILQLTSGADTLRFDPRRLSGGVANWANANDAGFWETYVGYYDGTDATLYREGVLFTTTTIGEAIDATPGNLRIGEAGNGTTFFKGKMQFFAAWANYTGGLAGAQTLAATLETDDPNDTILAENPDVYFPMTSPNPAGEQPDEWILDNATLTKDTTNYETGTWSAQMVATVRPPSFSMRQKLFTDQIRDLRGGWATIAARVRINEDEDNAGFAARVAFTLTGPDGNLPAMFSNSVQTGLYGFKWICGSVYVPPDLVSLQCWLFGNRNSHGIADASWDRAGVYRGKILRDPALLPM